jgi:glycosyltransferase involved in cell wall biosynthesis
MKKLEIVMVGASLDQKGGIATLEKLMLKYAPPELEIQHITSHDEGSTVHRSLVFIKAWTALAWRLLRQKPDLVHIHMSNGGSIIRKALLSGTVFIFRKPVVMHTNGAEFHITYGKFPQWFQQIVGAIFRKCDAFIAVTNLWRDYYIPNLELNEKKVFVLPNPTELPKQVPARSHSDPIQLVFFGRIGERKGAFDLVKAFAHLPNDLQAKTELIFAGDGEVERGKVLADELNVAARVHFLGWVDAKRRDNLLENADVFILPSYNEGLPLALMEAMGWGLPVITTPVSGIPDIVKSHKNGLLVPPGEIQQLSKAMQLLIEDESLRISLGRAARETVAPLDIRKFYDHLLDIYHFVL